MTPLTAVFLLICVTIGAYLNSLGGEFVYDDYDLIVRNTALRSWGNLSSAFGKSLLGYYRPFIENLFTLERQAFGLHAPSWHAVNVSLHLFVSLLVFALVRMISRGQLMLATLTAVLFALHPAHVESVAWVSGVSDVLMSQFFISSLIFYLRHQETGQNKWLAGSVVFYAAALLSKETALALPLLVFFFAGLRGPQTPPRRLIPLLLPYLAVTGVYFSVRLSVLGQLSALVPENTDVTNAQVMMTIPAVLAHYASILFFPFHLSVNYGTSFVESVTDWKFVAGVVLLLALVIGGLFFAAALKDSLWLAGMALLLVPLSPALFLRAFLPEILVQDRYLYLPLAGFSLLVALALVRLAGRSGSWMPRLAFVFATILILAFGAGTVAQNRVWRNTFMLQGRALAYAPQSVKAHRSLAAAFLRAGDVQAARRHMVEATNRPRPDPQDLISLAGMQMVVGDLT
ncbi:MAG TPA: hypothetical protein VM870_01710, partial [Pyrinomonadaceae bacterium]|nr:hypothetical protein [Pyrinomonadaceae bacterium]